jgi:ribosomal protein S27E
VGSVEVRTWGEEPRPTTPVPFSREEAESIREAFATPGAEISCPRCGELLTESRSSEREVRALSCERCRRILVVRHDDPGKHV